MAIRGVYAFEHIDDSLPYVPVAARRVLDRLGRKLSLEGWASLPHADRVRLVEAGLDKAIDPGLVALLDRADRPPTRLPPEPEPDADHVPEAIVSALGGARTIDAARWSALRPVDRYTLAKYAGKPAKLADAYDEIVAGPLAHVGPRGEARMVDVARKPETHRRAVATARVVTTVPVAKLVAAGAAAKGDVLGAARIAGIAAAKRTPELVPLCHPVRTTHAAVELDVDTERGEVRVRAMVEAVDRTGVEMEAMVAASVAALTVYDMIKSADRWATIDAVRLEAKSGGKSGDVARPPERS